MHICTLHFQLCDFIIGGHHFWRGRMEIITTPPLPFMLNFQTLMTHIHSSTSCGLVTCSHMTHRAPAIINSMTHDLMALRAWPQRGDTVRSHPNSNIQYPISNIHPLNPFAALDHHAYFPVTGLRVVHQLSITPNSIQAILLSSAHTRLSSPMSPDLVQSHPSSSLNRKPLPFFAILVQYTHRPSLV